MSGYGTDQELSEYLSGLGLHLPGSPPAAVLRQIGSDYVDGAYEARLQCSGRTGGWGQERAWPRTGHAVSGQSLPPDLIPQAWINASYRAAYLHATQPGWATGGRDPNRTTKRLKAGEAEVEYFGASEGAQLGNAAPGFNVDPLIDGMVSVLLCPQGRGNFLLAVI